MIKTAAGMKDIWGQDLERYSKAENRSQQLIAGLMLLDKVKNLSEEPKVLDLGCGGGELTLELAKIIESKKPQAEFFGVDISEGMIKKAKMEETLNKHFEVSNITMILQSISSACLYMQKNKIRYLTYNDNKDALYKVYMIK